MRGAIDVVQIDACRLGGVNEVLAVMLMAAKHGLEVVRSATPRTCRPSVLAIRSRWSPSR